MRYTENRCIAPFLSYLLSSSDAVTKVNYCVRRLGGPMFQKFRPLSNHVWVELVEQEQKTAGGIIIPDAAQEKTQTAKILAVGEGKRSADGALIPMQVKVGDTVFFGKYAGTQAGEKYMILKEEDILGIIEG